MNIDGVNRCNLRNYEFIIDIVSKPYNYSNAQVTISFPVYLFYIFALAYVSAVAQLIYFSHPPSPLWEFWVIGGLSQAIAIQRSVRKNVGLKSLSIWFAVCCCKVIKAVFRFINF